MNVIDRDHTMAASGVVSIGNEIGVLGTSLADGKSSAVFRLLHMDGQQQWQHVEGGPNWNFPGGIFKTSAGYILVSIENDYSPSSGPSTLIFTLVSDRGAGLFNAL